MRILSFDIEDWFHILDNESTKTIYEWRKYESRIQSNVERILSILSNSKNKATFFILGWVAEKYPEIVKQINEYGYEIGSHSNLHQLAYLQTRQEFKEDIAKSIYLLEDLIGKKVKYFRAPGFSITEKNVWSFDILHELGIEIDCSIFPTYRAHGGMPSFKSAVPCIIQYNGNYIKELPINAHSFFGHRIVFSGGGYFRLLPYMLIKKWTKNHSYIMSYFHPRDFDPDQPRIKDLSVMRKFKSYVGLLGAEKKLCWWLNDFDFIDISTANKLIDWGNAKVINIQ